MKLALVISSLSAGGAERVLTQMANNWCMTGHDVAVITYSADANQDFYPLDAGVRRRCLGFRRETNSWFDKVTFNISRMYALRRVLRELSPQAVISFMDSTNVLTVLAGLGLGLQTILSVRNNPKFRRLPTSWALGRRFTYRFASCVVAQTEGAANWIRDETSANVVVIPNPVRRVECSPRAREKVILAIGRMIPEKGHDVLIDAFGRIHADWPDWKLVILGDGPLRGENLKRVAAAGLSDRVVFPGTVTNVDAWLSRCGFFVHSSRSEGFPNALLEAMAAGVPVVSCDCEFGPRDIVENDVTGLLVPPEDSACLADAMTKLIQDDALREKLGSGAACALERFDAQRIMRRWDALLKC